MSVDLSYLDRIAELKLYAAIAWAAAALALVLLLIVSLRVSARFAPAGSAASRLKGLHVDRNATASMEYLLVLMPFLVIVMTVWQFAFMVNARLHLGYATFAAARSAAVMIPAELQGEAAGKLNKESSNKESKWTRIERAARPGTIAISPGSAGDAAGVYAAHNIKNAISGGSFNAPQTPDALGTIGRITLMSMHMCDFPIFCPPEALTGTRPLRAAVKDFYAQNMTKVSIAGKDSSAADVDLSGQEVVNVRVDYVLWLQVPWVGRLLEAMFNNSLNEQTGEPKLFNPYPSITLSEETSINLWFKKRATEPCS
ncbi:MAG TPA: hypothetical protein PKK10_02475 [Woeseiaceae bacterium]|nr:hypothetical protein [Woeseiaceae bacterium]